MAKKTDSVKPVKMANLRLPKVTKDSKANFGIAWPKIRKTFIPVKFGKI